MSEPTEDLPGTNRRDLLKKGVVAGALAWTAPMVVSSPAFGQTASPFDPCDGARACSDYIGFRRSGNTVVADPDLEGECVGCSPNPTETFVWSLVGWTGPGTPVITPNANPQTATITFPGITGSGSATITVRLVYTVQCGSKVASVTVTQNGNVTWSGGSLTGVARTTAVSTNPCTQNRG